MLEKLYNDFYFDCGPACVAPHDPPLGSEAAVKLFVRARAAADIVEIFVRTTRDNEELRVKMRKSRSPRGGFIVFTAKVPILVRTTGLRFKIHSKNKTYWLNARGLYAYNPNDYYDFRIISGDDAPSWVRGSVFYQIFPDRFWHGLSPEDYAPREKLEKRFKKLYGRREVYFKGVRPKVKLWHEPPDGESLGYEFYMGTLDGIAMKTDYLKELGANAIYLTPIFKSPTNHRYDTTDYFQVDPLLGGNSGFKKFMDAMRHAGIRVIVDAVFNHSGFACDMFKKARKGIMPYAEFYNFYGRGRRRYACWLGHGNLPKLDYASEKLRDLIYRGRRSAAAKWLLPPYAVDGYRLDVAHMIGKNAAAEGNAEILSEMKDSFKKFRPDAFVLAENFFDSREMVANGCVDSVMNYHGFTFPVIAFLSGRDHSGRPCELTCEEFRDWILDCYAKLPQARADIMYNQLSSHDVSRHNSLLGMDYATIAAAILFQFTFPGVPSIFYGDEAAITGIGDPACRAAMKWDETIRETPLFLTYKTLAAARRRYKALAGGGFRVIKAENGVFCYIRKYGGETALCAVNRGPSGASPRFENEDIFITGEIGTVETIFDSTRFESRAGVYARGGTNEICAAHGWVELVVRAGSSFAVYIREAR